MRYRKSGCGKPPPKLKKKITLLSQMPKIVFFEVFETSAKVSIARKKMTV